MRSAFIARNEKVEVKDRSPQKEIQPEGKREAKSRSKRTVGSGIREGSDNCEVLRGKSPTAAATLQGSGHTIPRHLFRRQIWLLLVKRDMRRARQPKSRAEKSTSASKKDDLSPKGAPRSPAFSQALTNARSYAKDPKRLRQLFKEAVKKSPDDTKRA